MAAIDPRPTGPRAAEPVQPAGAAGDGLDSYPTYRDGPVPPHVATVTKPTDTNLPLRRRTSAWPMLLALALIAAAVIAYLLLGGINALRTTDDAMSPGGPATEVAPAPAGAAADGASAPTDSSAADTSLGSDEEVQTETGPGAVEATPGPVDVPGGEATTPVQTAPAQ